MGFDLWAPLGWEQGQLLKQQNARDTQQQFAQKTNGPGGLRMVSALVGNRRMYPWMQPGAQASLGLAGFDPGSEPAMLAAKLAANKALTDGQWATNGQWTDGSSEQAAAVGNARSMFGQNLQQQVSGLAIGKGSQIPSSALPQQDPNKAGMFGTTPEPQPGPMQGPPKQSLKDYSASQVPQASQQHQFGSGIGAPSALGGVASDVAGAATGPARAIAAAPSAVAGVARGAARAAQQQGPAALKLLGKQIQAAGRLTGPQSDTPYSMAHAQQQRASDVASLQQGPGPLIGAVASPIPGALGVAKGISRGVALAGNAPFEAVQGTVRNVAGAANDVYNLAAGNKTFGQVGGDLLNRAVPGASLAIGAATGGQIPTHAPIWGGAQTQGGQALIDMWNGRNVDVGSGFFPDIASKTGKEAGAAARSAAPTINGHAFTLGRGAASIFSPDTVPYDLLSGGIDAAAMFSGKNPANMAFEPLTEAIQNRNLVTGYQTPVAADASTKIATAQDATRRLEGGQKIVDSLTGQIKDLAGRPVGNAEGAFATLGEKQTQLGQVRDQLATAQQNLDQFKGVQQTAQGFADTAHEQGKTEALAQLGASSTYRKAVDRPTTYQAIVGDRMQGVVKALTPVDSPAEIWRASGGQIRPDIAGDLAAAKTDQQTEQVFTSHLGSDINPMPTVKTTGIGTSRIGEYLKASTIPGYQPVNAQRDLNDALPKIDAYLQNMKIPVAERNQVFDQYVAARTPGDFFAADDNFVKAGRKPMADEMARVLTDGGLTPEQAQPIADAYAARHLTAYRDSLNSMSVGNTADIVDNPAGPVYGVFKGPNGDQVIIHKPMIPEEFLKRDLILADPAEMRELARHPAAVSLAKIQARDVSYKATIAELESKISQVDAVPGGPTELATGGTSDTRAGLQDQLGKIQALKAKNDGLVKWTAKGENIAGSMADTATQIFKRAKLVRAGYGLRRVTDGMLQMAAHAYSGPLTHPFHFLTTVASSNPDSRLGKIIDAATRPYADFRQALIDHAGITLPETGASRSLLNSVTGSVLQDDKLMGGSLQDANMQDFLNLSGKNQMMMPQRMMDGFGPIPSTDPAAPQAWLEELSRIRRSPTMTGILDRSGDPEAAHQWFLNGGGRQFREQMATDPQFRDMLTNDSIARANTDNVMARLNSSLGGERAGAPHPDLINYVKTGRLNQASNNAVDIVHGGYHQIGPEDLAGYRDFMPSMLRAHQELTLPGAIKSKWRLNQAVDWFLHNTATRPDNFLVRGPVWKQAYWEDGKGGVPLLHEFSSSDVQAKTIEEAKLANVRPEVLAQLERTPAHVGAGTITDQEELHSLAGMYAAKQSNVMLHNFSQRNQAFDSLRNIAPFGDAWKQIIQRWGRAAALNPKVLLRLEQGMRSARGAGIFTKDPTTGQEVFSLPGTQWLTKAMTGTGIPLVGSGTPGGVPVPMEGSVDGLSMLGQVYPGVGPMVSLPTNYLQEKMGLGNPGMANNALSKVLFPYGTAGYDPNPIHGAIDQMLPSWTQHLLHIWSSPTTSREYASTLEGAVDYLASSGRYDLHGANANAETSRMIADAHSAANVLELIRGGASFFSPSAPIPKHLILDKHNQLQEISQVRNAYYSRAQKEGSTKAYQWVLNTYGPNAFTATIPWSVSSGLQPRTTAGYDFAAAHSWMQQIAPDVYGALVPESGNPDLTSYDMSFRNGSRVPATPENRIKLANNRLASYQYDQWVATHPTASTDDRNAKKTALRTNFPGYQDQPVNYNKIPNQIAQLKQLVNDPRAAATPEIAHTVQFIKQYLQLRDQAIKAGGTKTLKSNKAAGARDWLVSTVARSMYSQDPGFAKAWDALLKYEFPKGTDTNFKNTSGMNPTSLGTPGAVGTSGSPFSPSPGPRVAGRAPGVPASAPVGVFNDPGLTTTPGAPAAPAASDPWQFANTWAAQEEAGSGTPVAGAAPTIANLGPGTHDNPVAGERPPPVAKKATSKKSYSSGSKTPKKKSASKSYTFGK